MISEDTPAPETPEPSPIDRARRKFALGLFGAITIVGFTGMTLAIVGDTTPQAPLFTMGASTNSITKDAEATLAPAYLDPNTYVYKAADSLTLDGQPAHIYRLIRTGDPEDRVRALAEIFNVNGDLDQVTDGIGKTIYEIRNENPNGNGSLMSLYWSGPGSWNYTRSTSGASVGCASPAESGPTNPEKPTKTSTPTPIPPDVVVEPCVLPTPPDPSVFPDEETAKGQALTIFSRTGLVVTEDNLTYLNTGWDVSVRASMHVAGEPIALEWTVTWDQTGEIVWASGYSVRAEDTGTFDTISDKQAVTRLGDTRWYGSPASAPWWSELKPLTATGIARDAQAAPPPPDTTSVDGVVGPTGEVSQPAPAPVGTPGDEPLPSVNPTPQIVYITISHSERGLLLAYDNQGEAWVVPGYLLSDGTGAQWSVISLEDGVIELADPIQAIPMLEGAPGEPAMK